MEVPDSVVELVSDLMGYCKEEKRFWDKKGYAPPGLDTLILRAERFLQHLEGKNEVV